MIKKWVSRKLSNGRSDGETAEPEDTTAQDAALLETVRLARNNGVGWLAIAATLGTTAQAARLRFQPMLDEDS